MTADQWSRVRTTLEAVLERPSGQRTEFLDLICAGDYELRSEVEDLLRLESKADALFAADGWNLELLEPGGLTPGTAVGTYRILRLIGEGGMGTVYLAERADAAYTQQVAIKVVRGSLSTSDARERFLHERQTLARLSHPGIARLLDGGVIEDGRPFLVMEYVDGRPLHQFCDEERLGIRERIQLVVRICGAIQSAHQNLIIHRDLKPANILVTKAGDPKLLDFGIAKWLDSAESPQVSRTIQILTPSYASPEQACQEPIGTTTDVYSIAVLLFELLSGSLPHPVGGLPAHEAIRLVAQTEPQRASEAVCEQTAVLRQASAKSLRRSLQGDLDIILSQALRREPERRYATVDAFAADLERFLLNQPVQARPDSALYRFGKFVRRSKALVTGAGVAICSLAFAAFGLWHGYEVAQTQRAVAERRYENGRKLVQSYLTEIDRKLEGLAGTAEARRLIAQRNLEYLDRMSADAQDDLPLLRELAQAYFVIGRTERMMARSKQEREAALTSLDKAVHLRRMIFNKTADMVDRGQLAYLLSQRGAMVLQSGRLRDAVAHHQEACALAQPIFAGSAKGLNYLRAANACWNLATDYSGNEQAPYLGKFDEGLKGQLETLARFEHWRDANPDNPMGYPYVASMEAMTGEALWRVGRTTEARQHFEAALSILHGTHGMTTHELALGYLIMADVDFAMLLADAQEQRAALPHAQESLRLARTQMAAQNSSDSGWESFVAYADVAAGRCLVLNGQQKEGISLVRSGLGKLRDIYSKDKLDAEAAGALAQCDLWAIDAEQSAHHFIAANRLSTEVITLATTTLQLDPDDASAKRNLQIAHATQVLGSK